MSLLFSYDNLLLLLMFSHYYYVLLTKRPGCVCSARQPCFHGRARAPFAARAPARAAPRAGPPLLLVQVLRVPILCVQFFCM